MHTRATRAALLATRACAAARRTQRPPALARGSSSQGEAPSFDKKASPSEWNFVSATETLFKERGVASRQLGLDWHAWQLFCACIPVAVVYAMAMYAREEQRRLKGRGGQKGDQGVTPEALVQWMNEVEKRLPPKAQLPTAPGLEARAETEPAPAALPLTPSASMRIWLKPGSHTR